MITSVKNLIQISALNNVIIAVVVIITFLGGSGFIL